MKSRPHLAVAGCDVKDQPIVQGTLLWHQFLRFASYLILCPVCVDAVGYKYIYSEGDFSSPKGRYHPRPTLAYQTAHTMWAYIHAWQRAAGCSMGPTRVAHSRYSSTISEGAWERVSYGLCKIPAKVFPAGRCLRRRRGNGRLPNYEQWSCPD